GGLRGIQRWHHLADDFATRQRPCCCGLKGFAVAQRVPPGRSRSPVEDLRVPSAQGPVRAGSWSRSPPDVPAARGATGSPRPPTAQLSRGGSRAAARILGAARAFSPLSLVVRAQPYPRARSLHVAAGAISQRRPGLRLFWSPNRISEA